MKKLFVILSLLPCLAHSQPAPTFEASSAQTAAMTVGAPFYISPRRLGEVSFVATNIPLGTFTNYINTSSNQVYGTSTNGSIQAVLTFFSGITNAIAFTNGPPVAGKALVILGTNVSGLILVGQTNWPTGGSGTGTLMPPNALGVLTNNGSGSTNWSTSILGTWIGSGTLPNTAPDSSWMPITNAVAYTNGPPTAGQALVVVGTNSFGAVMAKGTNWPAGGSAPNGLVTNTSPVAIIGTNAGVFNYTNGVTGLSVYNDTNAAIHIDTNGGNAVLLGTNGLAINTGNSNFFGGISYISSNAAPSRTISPSGLNSIILNQRFTNNFNRLADLEIQAQFTDAATGNPVLAYTNTVTGQSWSNAPASFLLTGTSLITIVIPDISPNDFGSFSNYSGTGASVSLLQSWWHLK